MASTGRSAPLVFSTPEALRDHANEAWTNSFSATTLPPGCAFFHDLGVLAYDGGFPAGFFAGCEPVLQDGISMHAVEVTETNDVTRVWHCPGAEIGQFPVPADYNAEAWALQRFPLPPYLDEPARAARLAEAKLGGRQTLRMRLIPQASIPAYLASLATRAANRPAQIGTNDIGAVSTRLLPGQQGVEVLVHAPEEVSKIGVYQAPELTAHPDWMFQGFAVRLDNPVAFQVALDVPRRYILFANHQRDSDGDRLPDAYEELITGTRSDLLDSDADGLDDWEEIALHMTSATSADTDGDGRSDTLEIELGLNPRQGAPTTDTDWDGDGLREDLELLLGSNPHSFDPAPNLNLLHEAKTRTVVLTKFGFRPFQACEDCNPPKEQFFLRGIFTETGLTSCPGGDRTNSTATATVTFSPFGEPQVSETITGVTGSYVWTRPPLSYLDPRLCNPGTVQTNDRSDQLWNGEEHYQYTAAPCPEQPSTHTLELSQALEWEYSDLLLEAWANVLQIPEFTPYPSDWNDTNTRTYSGPNPPRVSNVSDLHLSSQIQEMWDLQGCPDFSVVRLEENVHSLASRWVAKGAEPGNLEVIALRDSKTRVTQDPQEPVAPMLQSISTVEYHVPADGEGGTAHLVGRRTFRKAGGQTIYARDHGMAGTEEPELKSPTKPGQVFVIPDPIQAGPVGGVQTIVKNQYLMLWGNGPSTTAVFQVSLNDSLAGVDWQAVPGTTVGLRVQGPAGGVNATLGGQPLAFGPDTFGPAPGLYVPSEFSLTFSQPGSYTFAATLEGPNVLGETRIVCWKVNVLNVELNTDINNDGLITTADTSLKAENTDAGTEFLFVNDGFSNGLWDNNDSTRPAGLDNDDDAQELKVECESEFGVLWFEHPQISNLNFYRTKACAISEKVNFPFDLASGGIFPDSLFVRAEGEFPAESQGDLVLKCGTADMSQSWCQDRVSLTIVRNVGDTMFFNAARDYILENNARLYATRKSYGGEEMRVVVMRQSATTMTALDTYNHSPRLRGIDAVVAAYGSKSVVINGNFQTGLNLVLPVEATQCLGRLISGGILDSQMSLDSAQNSSVFASSNAYYVAQAPDGTFVFSKGEVPLAAGYQEALGGLYRDYAAAENDASTLIGQSETGLEKMIFVAVTDMNVSSSGAGGGVIGFKNDATVGSGASAVYLLDGSTSSALAHSNPGGTLIRQFQGSKHTGRRYYIHNYLLFECSRPR